jgi:hypothetical protein
MFCSKCGQEQASESVRFCARCGSRLGTGEDGLVKRLIMMAMYLVITMFAIIGWGSITAGPGYMQIRVFIAITAAISFYLLFSSDMTHILSRLFSQNVEQKKQIAPVGDEAALAPAQGIPVNSLRWHRVNTAEMVQPPSVTEQTTSLLNRDEH